VADVLVTLLCLVLLLKAAGWTLGDRRRVRVRSGYTGLGAAAVVLAVGTLVTFVIAVVLGHVW
jgi:hypothetical protein